MASTEQIGQEVPLELKANATLELDVSPSQEGKNNEVMPLEYYYRYASILVRSHIPLGEFNEEVHDLIQSAVSEFWFRISLGKTKIFSPKAYLRSIVHSRCIDLMRYLKRKSTLPLSIDQDGEPRHGKVLLTSEEDVQDPFLEIERKELIEQIIGDVTRLPTRQRHAMICILKDEIGDSFPLEDTFRKYKIDISAVKWPQENAELRRLRSSLSVARKKLLSLKNYSDFA